MHEYSIVSSLIDRVDAEAKRNGATSVAALTVQLGEISGVDGRLLSIAFDTFRERTICASAKLTIETLPAKWTCRKCGASGERGGPLRCLDCNLPLELSSGDEIILAHLELEVPEHV